ncbi:GNAT family N-acetyltransferase [Corynebacterium comes]|uniref:Acetyltransferase (GNAT) family protein n=1 Tax=Corynebacterium comes TaxID=2675218 RepID=A0A6B8VVT9_9CORY|nr:GNAT family N-acetyltransferase [Corynebacterium comes]QGU05454.1 Acetyltransferase (GNAT) family protein [Corynebacterium comes]
MADKNFEITHNEGRKRFEISVDGREAGYASYVPREEKVLDFNHTVVDQAFRGQGLSTPLIRAALDWAREEGASVRTTCSAVEHFVKKNEDYREICVD